MNNEAIGGLQNACPAITLRVRREVLGERLSRAEADAWYARIAQGEKVQKVLSWQGEDGFFGTRMHTPESGSGVWAQEGCLRYLAALGLRSGFPAVRRGLDALRAADWRHELTGEAAEAFGASAIRAALLARFGEEAEGVVAATQAQALQSFRFLLEANAVEELCVPHKATHVCAPGKWLPNIYLLRTLAFTTDWRNAENLSLLRRALEKLYLWLPLPQTYILHKSRFVSPPLHLEGAYNADCTPGFLLKWLEFYDCVARMGLLCADSPYLKHFERFERETLAGQTEQTLPNHRSFHEWTGYTGMALEERWNTRWRKRNDLLFRCALIRANIQ